MADRVVLFLDYQNIYMSARSLFHTMDAAHWNGQVDPLTLGRLLVERSPYNRELTGVRIYRGMPDSTKDPKGYGACQRQVASWRRTPEVEAITRTLRYPQNWPADKPQEKGIDVALAIDFVVMAVRGDYDVGVLMSTDTDLKPALEAGQGLTICHTKVAPSIHMTVPAWDEPTENPLKSTAVLLRSSSWRVRVVEKVTPLTKDHYELRRSYQFRMPIDDFVDLADADSNVDIFLPVCWLDKRPLLELDVTDQTGSSLSVVERVSNAGITAAILDDWIEDLASRAIFHDERFLEDVCYTSLGPWQQAADRSGVQDEGLTLYRYYVDLLELRLPPDKCDQLAKEAHRTLSTVMAAIGADGHHDAFASTLNPVILAPFTGRISTPEELVAEVSRISELVNAVADFGTTTDEAAEWVRLLHRSSRQWPILTRQTVQPGSELLIKTREVRPSGDARPARVIHTADLGGATSYHLEVRAPDPSIRLRRQPSIEDPMGHELGVPGAFDTVKWTNELFSAYSTSIDRPERPESAMVRMSFGLYPTTWVPEVFGILLNSFALIFALLNYNAVSIDLAAMLLIPTTVVSAFLSIRDSTLVSNFLRPLKWAQLATNLLLWAAVLVLVDVPGLGR